MLRLTAGSRRVNTARLRIQLLSCAVQGSYLWIIMEYVGGGSALDLLKPGPIAEEYIAIILREILRGLDYLHSERKLHRDIKGNRSHAPHSRTIL